VGWRGEKYYRVKRVDGRIVREYVGTGPAAEIAATIDEMLREERRAQRADLQDLRADLRAEDAEADGWSKRVDLIVTLALEAAGLHRHKRQWRRKRSTMRGTQLAERTTTTRNHLGLFEGPPLTPKAWTVEQLDDMERVFKAACAGDATALPALREAFTRSPDTMIALTRGDLSRRAEEALVNRIAGTDLAHREGIASEVGRYRDELLGTSPTALQRLLVDRVVWTWLDLHLVQREHARNTAAREPKVVEAWDRRLSRANARHLASLKALAAVQKLGLPGTLVQVNIASPAAGAPPTVREVEGRVAD